MVTVRISETFDLSTKSGKLGLLGIHTPPRALIERHFGGLMQNFRFMRFKKADVVLAPTATLPLDPIGVGVAMGQVNPEDAVNPVLYKAVSNDHFETIISRIYGGADILPSSAGSSLTRVEGLTPVVDPPVGMTDRDIYYGLLSQSKGWRKALWNTGFAMTNLKPLFYEVITNVGNENFMNTSADMRYYPSIGSEGSNPAQGGGNTPTTNKTSMGALMRGRAQVAPGFPLWQGIETVGASLVPKATLFPTCYVGAIIVPPASPAGNKIFYRMRITWTLEFYGLVSTQEHSSFLNYSANGGAFFWSDWYVAPTSKMPDETDMVDVNGVDIEKVMESGS